MQFGALVKMNNKLKYHIYCGIFYLIYSIPPLVKQSNKVNGDRGEAPFPIESIF